MATLVSAFRRLWVVLLVSAGVSGVAVGQPQFDDPSFQPDSRIIGPSAAMGAVIFLHGWCPGWEDCSGMPTPPVVREFAKARWDIYRVNVPPSKVNHDNSTWERRARHMAGLAAQLARHLRSQGYSKITLTGYSGGAVSAISAGASYDDFDTIIAFAVCCGQGGRAYISANGMYRQLRRTKAPRVAVFQFSGEKWGPANFGRMSEKALSRTQALYRVYDQPTGFDGHMAGTSQRFAQTFGSELVLFSQGDTRVPVRIRID